MLLNLGLATALSFDLLHDGKWLLFNRVKAELFYLSMVAYPIEEIFGKLLRSEEGELGQVGEAESIVDRRIRSLRAKGVRCARA